MNKSLLLHNLKVIKEKQTKNIIRFCLKTYLAVSFSTFLYQVCQIMLNWNTTIVPFLVTKHFPLAYTIPNSRIYYMTFVFTINNFPVMMLDQNKLLKPIDIYSDR